MRLGAAQDAPDRPDGVLEVVEVALLRRDDLLPVPLVDVDAVVVVEEVVLAHRAHVGDEALAGLHPELLEGEPLPLRGGLDDLRVDGVDVVVVRDVELDRRARTVAVEHVVDARLGVDDERDLDPDEVQLAAQARLDLVLDDVDGLLRLARTEDRVVVLRQDLLELGVVADAGAGKVGFLALADQWSTSSRLSSLASGSGNGCDRPQRQPEATRANGQEPIGRLRRGSCDRSWCRVRPPRPRHSAEGGWTDDGLRSPHPSMADAPVLVTRLCLGGSVTADISNGVTDWSSGGDQRSAEGAVGGTGAGPGPKGPGLVRPALTCRKTLSRR